MDVRIVSDFEIDEDIFLCLKTLYSVEEGTQPLDRGFGLDGTIVGYPVEILKNKYALDIIAKTKKYEPRVKVTAVDFENTENGTIRPIIHIEKEE